MAISICVFCLIGMISFKVFPLYYRAGSSSVVQMSCSVGLGLLLSRLYEEHFRYVYMQSYTVQARWSVRWIHGSGVVAARIVLFP